MKARKQEIDAWLQIQELKLRADVTAANRAIAIYRNTLVPEMRDEFNDLASQLGVTVRIAPTHLLSALQERLATFGKDLGERQDGTFVARIFQEVNQEFDRITEQLGGQVGEAAVPADQKSSRE